MTQSKPKPRSEADILDRLRKLLALASSPNVHEAALAAQRAAELCRQYETAAAAARGEEGAHAASSDPIHEIVLDELGRTVQWKGFVADGAATSMGCLMYWARGGSIRIFGRSSRLQAVSMIYRYIVDQIDRLAEPTYQAQPQPRPARGPWKHSYRSGAAHVVRQRLAADRADYDAKVRATATGKALAVIVADDDELTRAFAAVEATLADGGKPDAPASGDGYRNGMAAGASLGLAPDGASP